MYLINEALGRRLTKGKYQRLWSRAEYKRVLCSAQKETSSVNSLRNIWDDQGGMGTGWRSTQHPLYFYGCFHG
jgi:hypothetical protein